MYPGTWLFAFLPGVAAWELNAIAVGVVGSVGLFAFLRHQHRSTVASLAAALDLLLRGLHERAVGPPRPRGGNGLRSVDAARARRHGPTRAARGHGRRDRAPGCDRRPRRARRRPPRHHERPRRRRDLPRRPLLAPPAAGRPAAGRRCHGGAAGRAPVRGPVAPRRALPPRVAASGGRSRALRAVLPRRQQLRLPRRPLPVRDERDPRAARHELQPPRVHLLRRHRAAGRRLRAGRACRDGPRTPPPERPAGRRLPRHGRRRHRAVDRHDHAARPPARPRPVLRRRATAEPQHGRRRPRPRRRVGGLPGRARGPPRDKWQPG